MIVEIALGIVLAVLILAFLPQLLGIGIAAILLGLLVVAGIFAYAWVAERPGLHIWALAIALFGILFAPLFQSYLRLADFCELHKRVQARSEMGYDTTDFESQLDSARSMLSVHEKRFLDWFPSWFGYHS